MNGATPCTGLPFYQKINLWLWHMIIKKLVNEPKTAFCSPTGLFLNSFLLYLYFKAVDPASDFPKI